MLLLALTIVSTVAGVISALSGLGLLPQRQARPQTPQPSTVVIVVKSTEALVVELQDDGRCQARSLPRSHREADSQASSSSSRQALPELPAPSGADGEPEGRAASAASAVTHTIVRGRPRALQQRHAR